MRHGQRPKLYLRELGATLQLAHEFWLTHITLRMNDAHLAVLAFIRRPHPCHAVQSLSHSCSDVVFPTIHLSYLLSPGIRAHNLHNPLMAQRHSPRRTYPDASCHKVTERE